jgi:hypothetical protein
MDTETREQTLRRWAAAEGAMVRRAERLRALKDAGRLTVALGHGERRYAERLAARMYPNEVEDWWQRDAATGDLLVGLRYPQYRIRLDGR